MSGFLTDIQFEKYKKLIYDESGITFSSSNRSILESRLRERVRSSTAEDVDGYYQIIIRDEGELKGLLDSVTTNLTRFFRNQAHIETFEYYVIPELIKMKREQGSKDVKVWSAGCSTGEEPYTLAMVLKETLPPDFSISVTASDISLKSLMIGKEGFYAKHRINGVPDKYLKKYFDEREGGYAIKEEIKSLIKFDYHNLQNDSGQRNLDVIFCRNVLIYFDAAAQKIVVDRFWESLAPRSIPVHRTLRELVRHGDLIQVPENRLGLYLLQGPVAGGMP
jgi:chemotaxis protein methyltransferase CheR